MSILDKLHLHFPNTSEEEDNILIKETIEKMKEYINIKFSFAMKILMSSWGISFKYLDKEAKEKISKMNLNFETFLNYSIDFNKEYVKNYKKLLPKQMHICLNDNYFTFSVKLMENLKLLQEIFCIIFIIILF